MYTHIFHGTRVFAAALFFAASGSAATLTHDYLLQNSLSDSLGGPNLVSYGGTIGAAGYSFDGNQGLSLTTGFVNPGDYSIVLNFAFETLTGFRKILDPHGRANEAGLYANGGLLLYYPGFTPLPGGMAAGEFTELILTRSAATGILSAYTESVLRFQAPDNLSPAIFDAPGNLAYFFMDDLAGSQTEYSAGTARRIRTYDGALTTAEISGLNSSPANPSSTPEPATAALLGTVLIGLGVVGRRRKS